MTIRVFLVDDHELVRRGLCDVLAGARDVTVIGEAATAAEAVREVQRLAPDVVLLDVRLPDGSGIDVCRQVRAKDPSVRFLVLTSYDDREALVAALRAGASGFVLKQIRGPALIDAVRGVAAGRAVGAEVRAADPVAAVDAVDPAAREVDRLLASLSPQEGRILAGIVNGLTNREIGDDLGIAEQTVKNHVTRLLAKLGVRYRTQAAVLGAEARHRWAWSQAAHGGDPAGERGTNEGERA
jgi:two-component system response regulator DevR